MPGYAIEGWAGAGVCVGAGATAGAGINAPSFCGICDGSGRRGSPLGPCLPTPREEPRCAWAKGVDGLWGVVGRCNAYGTSQGLVGLGSQKKSDR